MQQGGDDAFEREIGGYLDVDEFLRFLSVSVLLCNLDTFLGGSQNFYAYLNPKTDRFELWPWDLDRSFGAFPLIGSPSKRQNLSILKPNWSPNRLIERVLGIPKYREAYLGHLTRYQDTLFSEEKI